MVKVFLTSAEGMKTDLLPENINIRKVLAAFGLCADTGRVSVEGKILDGAELDNESEGMYKGITLLYAQKILRDNHMSSGRDRQKLRQSLNHSDNNRL